MEYINKNKYKCQTQVRDMYKMKTYVINDDKIYSHSKLSL